MPLVLKVFEGKSEKGFFEKEILALQALGNEHPNLVKCFGANELGSVEIQGVSYFPPKQTYYIAYEYCAGGDLFNYVAQGFTQYNNLLCKRIFS